MSLLRVCFILLILAFPASASATETYPDANKFWRAFRGAVITNDMDQIVALTRFPFEVRGADDNDPIIRYDKPKFRRVFHKLISQPVFVPVKDKIVGKSMLQIVEEKKQLVPNDYNTPTLIQIEQFDFRKTAQGWLFTRGYLDE